MAKQSLNKIFLSASIPYQDRDRKFFDTADVIAIRDSVRALATVVIPKAHLIWGGHPAITPLIRYVINKMSANLKEHVTLYQSEFFKEYFPKDNFEFEDIRLVKATSDRDSSLLEMRQEMMANPFVAGVFIGGMEGVIDEYKMFVSSHPNAARIIVASTGAAAKILYEEGKSTGDFNPRVLNDYAYMALFRDLLKDYL